MANSNVELEEEVRDFTDIHEKVVSHERFETVREDAKRHIRVRRSLSESEIDWYTDETAEEALNWATKLFLKVAAGELDSQTIQVGAIDHKTLLSKDDDAVTIWYRNMERAIKNINPKTGYGHTATERRTYEPDENDGVGGLSL